MLLISRDLPDDPEEYEVTVFVDVTFDAEDALKYKK